jgi:hypothetical protein
MFARATQKNSTTYAGLYTGPLTNSLCPLFAWVFTSDFYEDAKRPFEAAVAKLSVPGIEYAAMPPQPGIVATGGQYLILQAVA